MPSPSKIRKAIMQRQKRAHTQKQTQTQSTQTPATELTLEELYDPNAISCPVCMDDKPESKFLQCPNEHLVCIECLRNPALIQDHGICDCPDPYCTGFKWTCPLCRVNCSLDRGHALAVMQGIY